MNLYFTRIAASLLGLALLSLPCVAAIPDTAKELDTALNGSGKAQYKAIAKLGEYHEAADVVVPKLRDLLKSTDQQIRWRSARALGHYGPEAKDAANDLRSLLKDSDPIVQYHAAIALGKIEDKSDATVDALVDAATNKDPRVARAAIEALRHLKPGPQRVAAALKQALMSNDQAVMLHALEAIVQERGKAVPLLKDALKQPETAYLACTAIEQIGPPAAKTVPELTELLGKTKHSQLLIQTLLALASIGPAAQPAESAVVPLLDFSTDQTVPVAAAYALGSIGAKNANGALKNALAKNNPFLHMVASWSLAMLNPNDQQLMKNAVDALTRGLANNDPQIRTAAAKGLQKLQPPPEMVGPVILQVASDPDPNVSANIVNAIAGLGESAVPRLIRALQKPKARPLAIRVLTKLGPKAADAVPALIDVAKAPDSDIKEKVNFALAAIGPAAAPASEMLGNDVASNDRRIRESALYALREIGPEAKAAVPALTSKIESDDSFDAMASAWALARIAPKDKTITAKVLPVLVRGLSNDDELTRLNSVQALADLGPAAEKAEPELKKAAHDDKSPAVREAATDALKHVAD
ncbi:MAG TPA: HEAT repeat domain-containing protein [Lacipirellulaceae bacterium]|nr:HEAT repeat domain-containing protein [Lacipirellulaceae bacterium]